MQYSRSIVEGDIVQYSISGDFTIFFLNNIKLDIEKDIASGHVAYLVFDMRNVNYIDSAAISLLIMSAKYNDTKGKRLIIKNPTDVVKRIIDNAELSFVDYQYA
jgi:anti-anti-sigma factor